ncbi:MAG: hypothetical protein ACI8PD_001915, partial [Nitrospinales bacterium]
MFNNEVYNHPMPMGQLFLFQRRGLDRPPWQDSVHLEP